MIFCSEIFAAFFAVVFTLYWAMAVLRPPLREHARVALLVVASFYFYASWNRFLAVLIFATTAADYFVALGMGPAPGNADGEAPTRSPRFRRGLLVLSLGMNLGLLVYFKYANFFLDSLLAAVGHRPGAPLLAVILPVGISFYTFEAINYTVDTYRGRVRAERSLPHFLLFITFFPHLIAGPIVRARDFLPQTHEVKRWEWGRMELGLRVFLIGLFKKVVIADRMAMYVDPVFRSPGDYASSAVWVAVLAYSIQIYCDFSGYTDMAMGCADLLGYRLTVNFDLPYLATNVSEFWRRWHISLSTWLRDYLFIPLGGSRAAPARTDCNLMITMVLGGLWHGASWTFVIWGALHGALLVVHRRFRTFAEGRPALERALRSRAGTVLRLVSTFAVVTLCWVFFRAQTFGDAGHVLARLFVPHGGAWAPLGAESFFVLAGVVVAGYWVSARGLWPERLAELPAPVVGAAYALLLVLSMLLAPDAGQTFIYFQF